MKVPESALVLAAGFGKRMLPLTEDRPKPLLPLGKQTILDYTIDRLEDAGIANIIVNAHYKGQMIVDHITRRSSKLSVEMEDVILDTGGAVKAALRLLGFKPFYVANADTVWIDGVVPALERLAALWDDEAMDGLLLLVNTPADEAGDYDVDPYDLTLTYRPNGRSAPYMYAGVQLLHPRLFQGTPEGAFPMKPVWDKAEKKRRLCGVVHNGPWYHLSTPEALSRTDAEFRAQGR